MPAPPFYGRHIIADLEATLGLDDPVHIEEVLRQAAKAAGVTLIDIRLHHFGGGNGVTGVALLAESHISIHTWPESNLAAIDIFVCGAEAKPEAGLQVIVDGLRAAITTQHLIERVVRHEVEWIDAT